MRRSFSWMSGWSSDVGVVPDVTALAWASASCARSCSANIPMPVSPLTVTRERNAKHDVQLRAVRSHYLGYLAGVLAAQKLFALSRLLEQLLGRADVVALQVRHGALRGGPYRGMSLSSDVVRLSLCLARAPRLVPTWCRWLRSVSAARRSRTCAWRASTSLRCVSTTAALNGRARPASSAQLPHVSRRPQQTAPGGVSTHRVSSSFGAAALSVPLGAAVRGRDAAPREGGSGIGSMSSQPLADATLQTVGRVQ